MGRNYSDVKGDKNPNYKTGYAINGQKQGFYNSWNNMKARCRNPNHPKFKRYGGRGIKIYEPWLDIENFADWALNNGWEEGLSIDRIDNDGDYCPENCRWISMSENSRKKSTTKLTFNQAHEIRQRVKNGESEYDLAEEYGVVHGTIWFIVNKLTHVEEMECTKALKKRKEN
jgi:hypothetical protein